METGAPTTILVQMTELGVSFETIAPRYDATRGGERRGRRQAELLAPWLTADEPVVDIGVGTGVVALGLTERGFNVFGLDLAPAMARIAQSRIGPKVLVGNAGHLPLRRASLPQAFSVWVLHLMGDLAAMLAGVREALRPGARYLVVPTGQLLPGSDAIAEVIEKLDGQLVEAKATSLGMEGRTAESIIDAAERAGLHVETWLVGECHSYQQSPNEEADVIASRGYASLLSVSAENWRRCVEPAIAELRALPNADQPLTRLSARQDVVVLSR